MRWRSYLAVAAVAAWPATSMAVTQQNFLANTTGDIVALCDSSPNDPLHVAAVHFCQGFMVGAYRYYQVAEAGPHGYRLFCLPASGVSRDQGVDMFLAWARQNPQYMNEQPVDSLIRFAVATWPCPK